MMSKSLNITELKDLARSLGADIVGIAPADKLGQAPGYNCLCQNTISHSPGYLEVIMLSEYINAAMSKAVYEKLEDGSYAGQIPECPGTITFNKTLFECEKELRSVLEGWIIFETEHGDSLPIISIIS